MATLRNICKPWATSQIHVPWAPWLRSMTSCTTIQAKTPGSISRKIDFDPIRPGEKEFGEFEGHQRWRALRERLEFEPEETLWSRWKTRLTISRPLLALAAGLLITTTALGLIAYQLWQEKRALQSFIDQHHNQAAAKIGQTPKEKDLQQALNEKQALIEKLNATESRLEALDQPQINTPISEIIVDDTIHSNFSTNGKTELSTTLPPQSNFFALTLKIVSDAFPTYKIEFIDQNNRVVLDKSSLKPDARANQSGGPQPNEHATITISIPRSSFPAGQYTFRVSGQENQRTTLLESLRWTFK
jgi:hypothetical protein